MADKSEVIQYETQGTCCKLIQLAIENGTVRDVEFFGGCNGNLQGIKQLIKGMKVEDVISKLEGIKCGGKPTSCPDQLAQCLIKYQAKTAAI